MIRYYELPQSTGTIIGGGMITVGIVARLSQEIYMSKSTRTPGSGADRGAMFRWILLFVLIDLPLPALGQGRACNPPTL